MIITGKKEDKIIKGLLWYLSEKCNLGWANDGCIDSDKEEYKNYFELRKWLEENKVISKDDDLSEVLYLFKDLWEDI